MYLLLYLMLMWALQKAYYTTKGSTSLKNLCMIIIKLYLDLDEIS